MSERTHTVFYEFCVTLVDRHCHNISFYWLINFYMPSHLLTDCTIFYAWLRFGTYSMIVVVPYIVATFLTRWLTHDSFTTVHSLFAVSWRSRWQLRLCARYCIVLMAWSSSKFSSQRGIKQKCCIPLLWLIHDSLFIRRKWRTSLLYLAPSLTSTV